MFDPYAAYQTEVQGSGVPGSACGRRAGGGVSFMLPTVVAC